MAVVLMSQHSTEICRIKMLEEKRPKCFPLVIQCSINEVFKIISKVRLALKKQSKIYTLIQRFPTYKKIIRQKIVLI
jgi:hypothetical protein